MVDEIYEHIANQHGIHTLSYMLLLCIQVDSLGTEVANGLAVLAFWRILPHSLPMGSFVSK